MNNEQPKKLTKIEELQKQIADLEQTKLWQADNIRKLEQENLQLKDGGLIDILNEDLRKSKELNLQYAQMEKMRNQQLGDNLYVNEAIVEMLTGQTKLISMLVDKLKKEVTGNNGNL